jgi:hypothetical protein
MKKKKKKSRRASERAAERMDRWMRCRITATKKGKMALARARNVQAGAAECGEGDHKHGSVDLGEDGMEEEETEGI